MINKSVIILINQPFDYRNRQRMGIDSWNERGWNVEVWDLTPLVEPLVWSDFFHRGKKIEKIASYKEVRALTALFSLLISRPVCKEKILVDFGGFDLISTLTRFILLAWGYRGLIADTSILPEFDSGTKKGLKGVGKKIKKLVCLPVKKSSSIVLSLINQKITNIFFTPYFGVASGKKQSAMIRKATRKIYAHTLDYDLYLNTIQKPNLGIGKYLVFLDEDMANHTDYSYQNVLAPSISKEKYLTSVTRFLNRLADKHSLSVVIAEHPRASENIGDKNFPQYDSRKGVTAELIRDAEIVVCHGSASIALAILFKKPLFFIVTDEIMTISNGNFYRNFAKELGNSLINIDEELHDVVFSLEGKKNILKYEKYVRNYIKAENYPDSGLWPKVISEVELSLCGDY